MQLPPPPVAPGLALHSISTSSCGLATGSVFKSTWRTTLNRAVFTPIPSARVRTATVVNPGALESVRSAYRTSRSRSSIHITRRDSWNRSCVRVTLPKARRAAAFASSGSMPSARKRSVSRAMFARISSLKSSSVRRRQVHMSLRLLWSEDAPHRRGQPPPLPRFGDELLPACLCQLVKAGLAIVVRRTPLRANPAARFEALHGGIERAVVNQERIFGLLLDGPGDALTMLRAKQERTQDQQVQRAL